MRLALARDCERSCRGRAYWTKANAQAKLRRMSVLDEAGLVHQAADVTARTSLYIYKKRQRDRGNIVTTTKDYADEIDMTATALARDLLQRSSSWIPSFFWCFRKFSTSGRGRVLKSKDHNFFYLIAAVAE